MQVEPCRHQPEESRTIEDKAKSLPGQLNCPALRGFNSPGRERGEGKSEKGKGPTFPTLTCRVPPCLHLSTPKHTHAMGNKNISHNHPVVLIVYPSCFNKTKCSGMHSSSTLENSGVGKPKKHQYF